MTDSYLFGTHEFYAKYGDRSVHLNLEQITVIAKRLLALHPTLSFRVEQFMNATMLRLRKNQPHIEIDMHTVSVCCPCGRFAMKSTLASNVTEVSTRDLEVDPKGDVKEFLTHKGCETQHKLVKECWEMVCQITSYTSFY